MYMSGKTNGKTDTLTQMLNWVFINQNDKCLKHQNRMLLLPRYFEGYSANPNPISRTRATSGIQNQEPIILQ